MKFTLLSNSNTFIHLQVNTPTFHDSFILQLQEQLHSDKNKNKIAEGQMDLWIRRMTQAG